MWNMISTSSSPAYDKTPGDREHADDSGRFGPIIVEARVWKGKVTVCVIEHKIKASSVDSVKAICIEKAINELFIFEKPTTKNDPKVKKLTDGKTIDI